MRRDGRDDRISPKFLPSLCVPRFGVFYQYEEVFASLPASQMGARILQGPEVCKSLFLPTVSVLGFGI